MWFLKGTQYPTCFIKVTSFLAKRVRTKGFVGTILMDLSKAYDCLPHNFLIAKLKCYGIFKIGLPLILDYLSRSKQRTKTSSSYSSWYDIIGGVYQRPLLVSLLFDIFINDLCFAITLSEVCIFAADNT